MLLFAPRAYRVPATVPSLLRICLIMRTYMPSLFKPICAVLCLIFALLVAPNAYADSFTPIFTCIGTCVSTPTAPAVTFPSPTLDITWNTITGLDVQPLSSLDAPSDSYSWTIAAQSFGLEGFSITVDINDKTSGTHSFSNLITFSCPGCGLIGPIDGGDLSFASTAAPEPSSLAFMLAGVGLMFAMRKRWTSGLQPAS